MSNLVVGRFWSKVSDALSPFKGLVFAAELKSTCGSIARSARLLYRLFTLEREWVAREARKLRSRLRRLRRYPRNRRFKKWRAELIRRFLEQVANRWLFWSFEISPILADIESAIGVLWGPRVEVKTVKASGDTGVVLTGDTIGTGWLWLNTASYTIQNRRTTRTRIRCVGAVKCVKPGTPNPALGSAQEWGLTFREFLPTVWELTPWSFLVDYFLNVGNLMNAISYHNTTMVYASLSKRTDSIWSCVARPGKAGVVQGYRCRGGPTGGWSGEQIATQFNRTPLSVSDIGFAVKYPQVLTPYLNMMALLTSKLTRKRLVVNLP